MKLPAQCRRWLNQIQPEPNDAPCARRIVVAYPYTHGRNRAPSSSMGYTSTRFPVPVTAIMLVSSYCYSYCICDIKNKPVIYCSHTINEDPVTAR